MKKLFSVVLLGASLFGSSFVSASQAGQLSERVAKLAQEQKVTAATVQGLVDDFARYFADKTPEQVRAFFEYVELQMAKSNAPSRFNDVFAKFKGLFADSKTFLIGTKTRTAVTLSTATLVALVTYWYIYSDDAAQEGNAEGFEIPAAV